MVQVAIALFYIVVAMFACEAVARAHVDVIRDFHISEYYGFLILCALHVFG